jgi:hypothetical protein
VCKEVARRRAGAEVAGGGEARVSRGEDKKKIIEQGGVDDSERRDLHTSTRGARVVWDVVVSSGTAQRRCAGRAAGEERQRGQRERGDKQIVRCGPERMRRSRTEGGGRGF